MPNINKSFVKTAKCDDEKIKQEFYDNDIKGFVLEVRANGRKTFFFRCKTPDNKIKYTKIGDATIIDVNNARIKAVKLKKAIEEGKDVVLDIKEDKPKIPTLNEFYQTTYLPYIQKHTKTYKANESCFKNHILPVFGKLPMDEIKKIQIIKAHRDMVDKKRLKPSSANKFLIFLSNLYTIALDMEIEYIKDNPVKNIKLFNELSHKERFLSKKETIRLIKAVNESQNLNLKYIIPFLILTGARRGEVLKAKWDDVDLINMMWTIPISKNGKKRSIPISAKLLELIKSIPKGSIYLFPSAKTGLPQNDVFKSWDHARRKAGLRDVRMHDLRHSFASILVNSGRSLYEVQTLLGHSNMKMTQRYAHLSNESLKSAVNCAQKLFE